MTLRVADGDGPAVELEVQTGRHRGAGRRGCAQLKEEPQPQVRVAFGFVMWNPASWRPSV